MLLDYQFVLQCPITTEDAKLRKLPHDICKLIIRCDEARLQTKDSQLKALAELLVLWRVSGESLIAQPINLFKPPNNTKDLLVEEGFDVQLVSDFSMSITCRGWSEVFFLLTHIEAEALVFFFASSPGSIRKIEDQIINNIAHDNQYERPYLMDLRDCDGFVFFADSHRSFEILGSKRMVMNRCFPVLAVKGS